MSDVVLRLSRADAETLDYVLDEGMAKLSVESEWTSWGPFKQAELQTQLADARRVAMLLAEALAEPDAVGDGPGRAATGETGETLDAEDHGIARRPSRWTDRA